MSHKKYFPESHIINTLLTLLRVVRSRWLDFGVVLFFCELMDFDSISVHKITHFESNIMTTFETVRPVKLDYFDSAMWICAQEVFTAWAT